MKWYFPWSVALYRNCYVTLSIWCVLFWASTLKEKLNTIKTILVFSLSICIFKENFTVIKAYLSIWTGVFLDHLQFTKKNFILLCQPKHLNGFFLDRLKNLKNYTPLRQPWFLKQYFFEASAYYKKFYPLFCQSQLSN